MENQAIEAAYPLSFRKDDAEKLGLHLKNGHSVTLVGMKRVGISNFLRFILNHRNFADTYIADEKNHLFIPIDLIDLVERELFPFWTLMLKRINDAIETSSLQKSIKKDIGALFLKSIQTQDLFFTIDCIRRSLATLVEHDILPAVFLIRFDRIKDAVTPSFFDNLQGVRDGTHQKLTYVFTSFRGLESLAPTVFTKSLVAPFAHTIYIKPGKSEDMHTIYDTYKSHFKLFLSKDIEDALLRIADGYVQYLHLALILLHEREHPPQSEKELLSFLVADERIVMQSEELWESLTTEEQYVLENIAQGVSPASKDKDQATYLWDTGFINSGAIFSPLFQHYILNKQTRTKAAKEALSVELTKKESVLFNFLKANINEICEREKIIEAVWPEEEALGVSDWAIDRLVARVRNKLKLQQSKYEIQTVKTRGYKLVSIS